MTSRSVLTLALACPAVLLPVAGAQAAAKRKPDPLPSISAVSPMQLAVGQTLTVSGRNFLAGRNRTTVVFKRDGGRAVFVKAGEATTRRLRVKVPAKLTTFLAVKAGQPKATRFRLRVLTRRFGKRFTSPKLSPTIAPGADPVPSAKDAPATVAAPAPAPAAAAPGAAPAAGTSAAPAPDCDGDGVSDADDPNDDGDLLSDDQEAVLGLNRCSADTDGDGMEDGWEFYSALDLNGVSNPPVPYPGKRPYPNPLDGSDGATDYDGDGLSAFQEYALYRKVRVGLPLSYSAGLKSTGATRDDLKDADADGLDDWDEFNGRMQPSWWASQYKDEPVYTETYAATDPVVADSDGDGILDGADDQDFDGVSNVAELSRATVWVQPFNPCLPDPESPTCSVHPPFDNVYEPFKTFAGNPPAGPIAWPPPPPGP